MTSEPLPSVTLSPKNVSDEELFWLWQQSVSPFFNTIPLIKPLALPCQPINRQYHVGQFLFVDTTFPRQKFLRDADWVRQNDDADHLLVQLFVRGSNPVCNGGTEFVEDQSSVFAVNLGYEVAGVSSDCEVLSLVLPRELLKEHLPGLRDARGDLFGRNPIAARLFMDFMLSLRRNLPDAKAADAPVLTQALLGLLGSLVTHEDPNSADANAGVMMALNRYIDDNLGDPELGVARLCTRFHVSRATLFRLFKNHGGVQTYIQRRRLMACFKALSAARNFHRTIYDVAFDFGFTNPSHLSNLFRKNFGMSPREVREAARVRHTSGVSPSFAAVSNVLPDVELMQSWARSLAASTAEG
jgi:AraC-like DNA-binding protein